MTRRSLGLTNSSSAVGVVGTPFFRFLTDDGTDTTLAENYSSAATDAYWQAPKDAVLAGVSVFAADNNLSQGATGLYESFCTVTLTNGLKFCVKDSAGSVVHDFTVTQPIFTISDLLSFGTDLIVGNNNGSATTSANYVFCGIYCNFRKKFGSKLFISEGYSFVCTLNDDLTAMDSLRIAVSGYYGG